MRRDKPPRPLVTLVTVAAFILVGCLSADRFGRKPVLVVATAATLVFGLASPLLLGSATVAGVMAFLCIGFVCMGAVFGPCGSYLPELFPANVRYSGAGLSYNLAAIVGGAFAPTIASALALNFGLWAVGCYLAGMAVLALVALAFFKESKGVDYEK